MMIFTAIPTLHTIQILNISLSLKMFGNHCPQRPEEATSIKKTSVVQLCKKNTDNNLT